MQTEHDDFAPPMPDELKQPADALGKFQAMLKQHGIKTEDLEPWGPCEPIRPEDLEGPWPELYAGIRITEGNRYQDFAHQSLGIAWFNDEARTEALRHAKQVAIDWYGFSKACTAKTVAIENEDAVRRAKARKLAPQIEEQFPILHRDFSKLRTTDWNRDATLKAMTWANHILDQLRTGTGLSIRHPMTGSGKTQLLVSATLAAVAKAGVHAYFVNVPDLIAMTYQEQDKIVKITQSTDILVLDDLDACVEPALPPADPDSHRSRKILYRIANARYNAKLPTLWSSNTESLEQLVYNVGDRTLRRLTERCTLLKFGPEAWDWGVWLSKNRQEELPDVDPVA